eukprot:5036180-Alexandrium_andersonii.AAC.1
MDILVGRLPLTVLLPGRSRSSPPCARSLLAQACGAFACRFQSPRGSRPITSSRPNPAFCGPCLRPLPRLPAVA